MRRLLIALSVSILCFTLSANAEDTILKIVGKTDMTANGSLQLTLSQFEAIGLTPVVTKTPWHKETTTFSGVSGKALLQYLGARSKEVEAIALNDYKGHDPCLRFIEYGIDFCDA